VRSRSRSRSPLARDDDELQTTARKAVEEAIKVTSPSASPSETAKVESKAANGHQEPPPSESSPNGALQMALAALSGQSSMQQVRLICISLHSS